MSGLAKVKKNIFFPKWSSLTYAPIYIREYKKHISTPSYPTLYRAEASIKQLVMKNVAWHLAGTYHWRMMRHASSGTGGREMKWWKEKLELLKTKTLKSLPPPPPPNPWKVAKVQRVEKRAQTADCWPLLSLFSVSCRNSAMRGCCLSGWPSTGACTSLIHWTSVRTPARL